MASPAPPMTDDIRELFLMNMSNVTGQTPVYEEQLTHNLELIIPLTVIYFMILVCGILGNISTCVVIYKNKTMHTATNYYLFSLAMSDLLLLLFGLPFEVYKLWYPMTYPLSETACVMTGLGAEMAANATVLTITAFTVERYIAICRPFHITPNLSRPVRFILIIWIIALITAVPQAMQYGVVELVSNGYNTSDCTVKGVGVQQVFVISSVFFFVVPMSIITILYIKIGNKLRTSRVLHRVRELSMDSIDRARQVQYKHRLSQRLVIRMLIAVVAAFVICWAPFHVQRVIAIYGKSLEHPSDTFYMVYVVLTYLSGVLCFLSTAINPILYSIMSNKFRNAFKMTLPSWCKQRPPNDRPYSTLLASQARARHLHRFAVFTTQNNNASPRVQFYDMRDPPVVFESISGLEHWSRGWRFDFIEPTDSVESPRSISNSSLREVDEELTGEEMATYLYETNCHIRGLTYDTVV